MSSQIIISVAPCDTRVALREDGKLAEFYLERTQQHESVGSIYKGRVVKVLPGIAAAFIDIGLERPAYLYVAEVAEQLSDFIQLWLKDEGREGQESGGRRPPLAPIEDLLFEGQELVVQVFRGPLGNKGARLTTHISLPGHYLVYLPTVSHVGVSRRISDEAERARLKSLLEELKPPEGGLIARTASPGISQENLASEAQALYQLWKKILRKRDNSPTPALLHEELAAALRAVRDLFSNGVDRLIIDDSKTYQQIHDYLAILNSSLKYRLELYHGQDDVFSHFGLDLDWRKLLASRVWLKSGGYILIQTTEALTAIDVNTGRFTGNQHAEDTILQTNLEAAREIARQLRLRNVGGLIIIDFIDMEKSTSRENVFQTFQEALKRDRAKYTVLPMSPFGLLEMTRQRLRDNLIHMAMESCPHCEGQGVVLSPWLVAHDLLRQLNLEVQEFPGYHVRIQAHPEVVDIAREAGVDFFAGLCVRHQGQITLVENPQFPRDYFEVSRSWEGG